MISCSQLRRAITLRWHSNDWRAAVLGTTGSVAAVLWSHAGVGIGGRAFSPVAKLRRVGQRLPDPAGEAAYTGKFSSHRQLLHG